MKWNKVSRARDDMPKDRVFLSIFRGEVYLTEWDDVMDDFLFTSSPADYNLPSTSDEEDDKKFSYWCDFPDLPEDILGKE